MDDGFLTFESHAHATARRLIADWLRDSASLARLDGFANFAGIGWRVNRSGPSWGIWTEYPIVDGQLTVWDEISDRWKLAPPTYNQVVALGNPPRVIVDVAIQHKGRIEVAFEVCHKHACSPSKIDFLRACDITLIEVPAYWALNQVDRPTSIPSEFFI